MKQLISLKWNTEQLFNCINEYQKIVSFPVYPPEIYHTTLVYVEGDLKLPLQNRTISYLLTGCELTVFNSKTLGDTLVLKFENDHIRNRRRELAEKHGIFKPFFQPHISLSYSWEQPVDFKPIRVNSILLESIGEIIEPYNEGWLSHALNRTSQSRETRV